MMGKLLAGSFLSLVAFSAGAVSVTFTDLNQKPMLEDQGGSLMDQSFDVTNDTGQTWTDFHLELNVFRDPADPPGAGGPTFFIDTASGNFDGNAYEGPGSYSLSNNNQVIDILGLSIPDGAVYSFTVDVAQGETTNRYDILGRPTVTAQVPEPGTLGLLVFGLTGMVAGVVKRRGK